MHLCSEIIYSLKKGFIMRKATILMAVVLIASMQACTQTEDVPGKVKTAFAEQFSNTTKISWDKENETEWEAEFKMNGKEYSANFDNNGNWKETEYEIEESEIPTVVKNTLNSEFVDYEVDDIEVSETPEGVFYEFELEKGRDEIDVIINKNGNIINSDKEDNNNDNENED
jgi:hypothetical protein